MTTLDENTGRFRHDKVILLWILFFCYATTAALFFQKLVLPLVPSLHAGYGLLQNDAIIFHARAIEIAESIKLNGWSSWCIWSYAFSVNVAILSALYALFGYDPSLILPVNALFHATGGVLVYLLGRELWPGKVGNIGGTIAASLFVAFPSALNWYGQLHKDGYVIAGLLLILLVWVRTLGRRPTLKIGIQLIVGTIAGMLLVAIARPYYLKLLFVAGLLLFTLLIFYLLFSGIFRERRVLICYCLAALIILGLGTKLIDPRSSHLDGTGYANWRDKKWEWQNNNFLPDFLEKFIEITARTRAGLIRYNIDVNAGSLIDDTVAPMDVLSVAAYMPRALQISLFAPFPASWFQKLTIMRLVSVCEMMIWYALFPGILLILYHRRSPGMVMTVVFCLFFLTILGFVSPNVGTLYRIRYGFLSVLMLIGAAGLVDFFLNRCGIFKQSIPAHDDEDNVKEPCLTQLQDIPNALFQSKTTVVGTGTMVIILTLLGYVGFFIRDLTMARTFGLGSEIDTFFIGSMLPMFLVTMLSIPLGAVLVPSFLEMQEKYSKYIVQDLVANIAFAITGLLALMGIVLYLFSPYVLPIIGWSFTPDKIEDTRIIMTLFLPILLLSGLMIMGNSILNSLGKFLLPGLAQLVVPLIAIIMLFALGHLLGITAVAIGMAVGLLVNLLVVAFYLKKKGFSLCPKLIRNYKLLLPLLSQYVPLIATAFLVSASIPIGNAMASSLSEGSVATLGLGTKLVVFITGIVGSGIGTVMVPYFSSLMVRKQYAAACQYLSFFLLLTTVISIPITVFLYSASTDMIRMFFEGGVLKGGDAFAIAKIMQFGIIQLPFFACGMLIMKFTIANKRTNLVLIASGIGLSLNIPLNLLFIRYMGVAGIPLATTLSIVVSTEILLIFMHRIGHIAWLETVLLSMGWLMYLTLMICLYYHSYAGIFAVVLAYGLLIGWHWRALLQSQKMKPLPTC